MSDDTKKWIKWGVGSVIVPLLISIVPVLLTWRLSKQAYSGTLLPIMPNPSVKVGGTWKIEYWELAELEPGRQSKKQVDPLFDINAAHQPLKTYKAQIHIKQRGARIDGVAMGSGRTWKIEGFLDGDSILYIYKDPDNPNSFGSAIIRRAGSGNEYIGTWSGVGPEFVSKGNKTNPNPFIVYGRVRWSQP